MARFPTYEEYRDKPSNGIQRCDELLKRDPTNATILITKLQLQATLLDVSASQETLGRLYASQPPVTDLTTIAQIEAVFVDSQSQAYPLPLSSGPDVAKLWDRAYKSTTSSSHKLDVQSFRFVRAIIDNRLVDAQQSLIQLKALSPKDRVFYMAHTALTQMLSTSKDDLQSRLALSLARKAVNEKFDEDKELDCRVPGQIFALQAAQKEIESILGSRFAGSKQIYDSQRKPHLQNREQSKPTSLSPGTATPRRWLDAELSSLKWQFKSMISKPCQADQLNLFAANAIRLFVTTTQALSLQSYRAVSEAVFLAISSLVKAWTLDPDPSYLLQSAFLAESLLRLQPKVHEAKVVLVYLYTRLGLGRPAYLEWDSLSTKGVQYDTFGHAFLSQLSITHPHYLTDIDPLRLIVHGLGIYRKCENKLAEAHSSVLSHEQTGTLFDYFELRQCLTRSATRRILSLEQRRLARLHKKPLDEESIYVKPRLTAAWLDMKDNRDFSATFNYGFNVERALHGQEDVKVWVLFGLAADSLWCLVNNELPLVTDTPVLLAQIESLSDRGTTPAYEWIAGELAVLALKTAVYPDSATQQSQLLEALATLHVEELIKDNETLPLRIRCVNLFLDALLLLSAFCKYAEKEKILSKPEVTEIHEGILVALQSLLWCSKDRGANVSTSSVRASMENASHKGVLDEIRAFGEEELETFCTSIAEASKDAWTGVTQCTKIGIH